MTSPTLRSRLVVSAVALVLLAVACGGGTSSDDPTTTQPPATTTTTTTEATTTTTTTEAPTTTTTTAAPVAGEINESFVGAIAVPYSGEPIVEGDVRVYFNNGSNGTLVAIYHGAGVADPTGLCPGNSLNAGGFQFISNAPATPGACDNFPTDRGSVRICSSGVWLYETVIPNDSAGDLYGSLEQFGPGDAILGMTAVAQNQAGTPVIDYSADVYAIAAMFTNDGSTEISCGPAMG